MNCKAVTDIFFSSPVLALIWSDTVHRRLKANLRRMRPMCRDFGISGFDPATNATFAALRDIII